MRLHSEEVIFLFFFLYRWTMKGEEWLPKRMGIENQSQLAVMAVYLHQVYVFFIYFYEYTFVSVKYHLSF